MGRIEVHKFGGTSLADAVRLDGAAQILHAALHRARCVGVVSAMAGVTDRLIEAAGLAARGDHAAAHEAALALRERHRAALDSLGGTPDVRDELERLAGELLDLLRAVSLLEDLTPRSRDRILAVGEKLNARLFALALRRRGVPAVARDADLFLETDGRFGEASALPGLTDRTVAAALLPHLEKGEVPVVAGFMGRAPDGATTTLGRGGTDLTATLVGAALHADEVVLWSDVDGVFSADPRVVPQARVVAQLNYREAAELSFYGAKVLHQRTMIPVAPLGIPVRSRNTLQPDAVGTVVDGRFTPGSHPVKAISAVRDQCLLSLEGKGMAGVPGVAARLFSALAGAGISVTMISQSSSESSICLAIPERDAARAEAALKEAFRPDLSRGDVEEIGVRRGVALLAAVGLGMAHRPGVAGRIFTALGRHRINILAIAQGSSELNVSLAVDAGEADAALRTVHESFGLHRQDTGVETADGLELMLLGCGRVGRALVEQVLDRHTHVFQRFGLRARIVAVADRGGYLLRPAGLGRDELEVALKAKAEGRSLSTITGAHPAARSVEMVQAALGFRLSRPVLVDVSDAEDAAEAFAAALRGGADVVTANKKPLAGPLHVFEGLQAAVRETGRILRAEATVGAGLPVVDTLEILLATGDRLLSAEGCLSGTLGFVMDRLEAGVRFSDAVREAVERGYTEPDPVLDLSGVDVARKAAILARLSGLAAPADTPPAVGLVDPTLAGLPVAELLRRLLAYDEPLARRVAEAREAGQVLRYVARVAPGEVTVGPQAVPADSPLGLLRGSDNMIVFRSERYHDRPLVVSGPGAGVHVTAMGVLGDVLRIAAERR
jgi:aspartokinase/homoserine dehydrogenase 1